MLKKSVDELIDDISTNLRNSSISYYKIGIEIFHETRKSSWRDFQPAIGNLSIATELLLKAVIAKKAFKMLYSNLPDEAQLLICYPNSLTSEHNFQSYFIDLKSFSFKTIELDKCVSLFNHFFPESKQEFKQFFSSLSSIRNVSVHASVPNFQRYELERIAYFSTKLYEFIHDKNTFKYAHFKVSENTQNFLKNYQDEKIKKVKASLDNARERVKKGIASDHIHYGAGWDEFECYCPICNQPALYYGETEEYIDDAIHLNFLCDSFHCESCGLKLDDYEELTLASFDTSIDRDFEVDKWAFEHDYEE